MAASVCKKETANFICHSPNISLIALFFLSIRFLFELKTSLYSEDVISNISFLIASFLPNLSTMSDSFM